MRLRESKVKSSQIRWDSNVMLFCDKITLFWGKKRKNKGPKVCKNHTLGPFFVSKIPQTLVSAIPGAIGRFARHRAILPLKMGRRMRRQKAGNPCKQRIWRRFRLPGTGGWGEKKEPEEVGCERARGLYGWRKNRRQKAGRSDVCHMWFILWQNMPVLNGRTT